MNSTKIAAKKRRTYLERLIENSVFGIFSAGLVIGGAVLALAMLLAAVQNIGSSVAGTAFFSVLALVLAGLSVYGAFKIAEYRVIAQTITYVPPVREQVATLPAEEILVRGSDQPVAADGELLRPAKERSELDAANELLRSAENGAR